jgi:Putative zinc-finger
MTVVPTREPRCASRLAFDRYLAGELDPIRATELELHASECARCRALLAELRRGAEQFQAVLPEPLISRVRERDQRRTKRWMRTPLWAAAALACSSLWLVLMRPARDPLADGARSKGGARITFYVLHDGAVRPGLDGERVHPGDAIEFAYTSERPVYLAILSIDGAQRASAYYERDGRAAALPAARRAVLDRSTVLDATLGPEIVYALLCSQPLAVAPLLRALEAAPERRLAAPDCAIERIDLIKVAR